MQQPPFDLVHAHDWLVAYPGRGLKHIYHIPLIATIHATEFGRNNGLHTDGQRYIGEVEWWLTYEAWIVTCCSRFMREEVQAVFNLPPDKIEIIPNGIRPAAFRVDRPDALVRQRFAAPEEKIIFFIGRLAGKADPFEALPLIRGRFPRCLCYRQHRPYEKSCTAFPSTWPGPAGHLHRLH